MGICSLILLGVVCFQFASAASPSTCPLPLGLEMTCPLPFGDDDNAFCCHSSNNVPYCCDIGDYIKQNSVILAGILIGAVIILVVITLCCCCFCSCCCLAKRRVQRGTVLYAPVAPAQVVPPTSVPHSPNYPYNSGVTVHVPSASSGPLPYPPPYPHDNVQPPVNPNYKY
ncbi:protein shisa-5-like [Uloborus diversus]|uniref:protein shisa-5-like n=1 Tax=Uloborus diversus TaxID=327109 RepID=UPI0024095E4A|nr:protein shisa-5-like [Uloborus diversus]